MSDFMRGYWFGLFVGIAVDAIVSWMHANH